MSNTAHRNYPKPVAEHNVSDDVAVLQQAMDLVDGDIHLLFAAISGLAPVVHEHVIADIQGLSAALTGKAAIDHSHTLEALSDVSGTIVAPTGYLLVKQVDGSWGPASPASVVGAHQHVIADIQNLQAALDAALATNINAATDEAPADTAMLGFRKADGSVIKRSWANIKTLLASVFLPLAGGTLSGNITVTKVSPTIAVDKTASGQDAYILGRKGGLARWAMLFGSATAESGGNVGSDFAILRYDDAGAGLGTAFSISRSAATAGGDILATAAQFLSNAAGKLLTAANVWASAVPVNLGAALAGNLTLDFNTFTNAYGTATANVTFDAVANLKNQTGVIRLTASGADRAVGFNTAAFATPDNAALRTITNGTSVEYSYYRSPVTGKIVLLEMGAVA